MSAVEPEIWRDRAACAFHDPEDWFPGVGRATARGDRALAICRFECPVREECLAEALSHGVARQHGIWGGTTERQRRKTLRRLQVSAQGTARRLRALAAVGWPLSDISTELRRYGADVTGRQLGYIRSGKKEEPLPPALVEAIRKLYEAAIDGQVPMGGRRPEPRKTARRLGWHGPEHWAGVDIDDPHAQPRIAA